MGYRRIGFSLTTGTDLRTDHSYLSAFVTEEYLNGTGFAIPPLMSSWQDFQASAADWVRRHRIEAVLTISEQAVSILRGRGFRVPEELGTMFRHPEPQMLNAIRTELYCVSMVWVAGRI